jgi:hypothetical protein
MIRGDVGDVGNVRCENKKIFINNNQCSNEGNQTSQNQKS